MDSKYDYMRIVKNTKTEIKIWFFYITDLAILLGLGVGILLLNKALQLPLIYLIIQEIIALSFGVFLCMKPSKYGGERNYKIIRRLIKTDKEVYHYQKIID